MIRPRCWLVVPAVLASAVLGAASGAEVRDKAGLFSPAAVKKAQADLDRLEKEYEVPVTVETIESLEGDTIARVLNKHAEAVGTEGVYILIPKDEHQLLAEASKHYKQYLPRNRMIAVQNAFLAKFKERDFDAGLGQGVEKLGSVFADAKAESGGTIRQNTAPNTRRGGAAVPARRAPVNKPASGGFGMTLIAIVVGILALLFVMRIFRALFGAMSGGNRYGGGGPMMGGRGYGPGGPGYGGGYGGAPAGGGGFMSSLFGGIGGAMAGNWLYDQFGNRHSGGGEQAGYDQGAGVAPVEDNSPEWSGNDAGADWGGGGGVADNSGAGDWGGGGDAGGGDWGGGGDDNGGSW